MSCTGVPDEGQCGAVLRDVWLFLDDELDPERRAVVQRHLDDCSPCLEEAGLDSKLKQLLQRKCGGDHAPEHLRQRVVASLTQVRVTDDSGFGVDTVTATSVTVQWEDAAEDRRDGAPGSKPAG
jgi:mycothiol system anti-sigma-R factor